MLDTEQIIANLLDLDESWEETVSPFTFVIGNCPCCGEPIKTHATTYETAYVTFAWEDGDPTEVERNPSDEPVECELGECRAECPCGFSWNGEEGPHHKIKEIDNLMEEYQ